MKKIINWFKSSKSDFALFILFLILINIVSYNAYIRFDLTSAKSYSLSKESKNLVKNLEQPLSVVLVKINDGISRGYYKIENPQQWLDNKQFFVQQITTAINNFLVN